MDGTSLGKDNSAALSPDTSGGGFQNPDYPQACLPVAHRNLFLPDTLREMTYHGLQCFSRSHVGAPDVTRPIADQNLTPFLGAAIQLDPSVIDLDRLGRMKVIKDKTLA
jgi:hypothetical protein